MIDHRDTAAGEQSRTALLDVRQVPVVDRFGQLFFFKHALRRPGTAVFTVDQDLSTDTQPKATEIMECSLETLGPPRAPDAPPVMGCYRGKRRASSCVDVEGITTTSFSVEASTLTASGETPSGRCDYGALDGEWVWQLPDPVGDDGGAAAIAAYPSGHLKDKELKYDFGPACPSEALEHDFQRGKRILAHQFVHVFGDSITSNLGITRYLEGHSRRAEFSRSYYFGMGEEEGIHIQMKWPATRPVCSNWSKPDCGAGIQGDILLVSTGHHCAGASNAALQVQFPKLARTLRHQSKISCAVMTGVTANWGKICPQKFGPVEGVWRSLHRQALMNDAVRQAAATQRLGYADWFQPGMIIADLAFLNKRGDCVHPILHFPGLGEVLRRTTVASLSQTPQCVSSMEHKNEV